MTKVYLIDEELLRQVLDALTITKKFCGDLQQTNAQTQ